jgi:hypothetical protein
LHIVHFVTTALWCQPATKIRSERQQQPTAELIVMAAKREEECTIILEANDNDVLLGRGNAVNFRGGNVRFRQLAQNNALRYATCSNKLEKDRIAASILSEIRNTGGRFLRPISARNDTGEHLPAWEPVDEEVAMTKAKQTLRDCAAAIRKVTAMQSSSTSPTSYESSGLFQSAITGALNRPGGGGFGTTNFLVSAPPTTSMQDSSSMALSLQRSMLEQLASLPMMDPSLGTTSSNANAVAARALSDQRLPYGLSSQMLLDDRQSRLLQAIRQQQQLADLESTSEESSGRSSLQHHHQQQPTSISNAISDLQRIRETLLIDEYRRERAIADAQQRMILNQLSEQARSRYEASFLVPSADAINNNPHHHHHPDESLRQILEVQRLQSLHGLDRLVSSSETGLTASSVPSDSLIRLAVTQNHFDQPVERSTAAPSAMKSNSTSPERKSSVSSEEERISSGLGKASRRSPTSSSRPTSQPPTKKAKTTRLAKHQQEEDSDG